MCYVKLLGLQCISAAKQQQQQNISLVKMTWQGFSRTQIAWPPTRRDCTGQFEISCRLFRIMCASSITEMYACSFENKCEFTEAIHTFSIYLLTEIK